MSLPGPEIEGIAQALHSLADETQRWMRTWVDVIQDNYENAFVEATIANMWRREAEEAKFACAILAAILQPEKT